MSLSFTTPFVPAATIGTPYSYQLETVGGVAPYSYAIISGSLPPGMLMLNDGSISGTPTSIGVFQVMIEVSDSAGTPEQLVSNFKFTSLDVIDLSNLTVEQEQFVQQLTNTLAVKSAWTAGITTQTSQTLIELVAAIGTFTTARLLRVKEDAFPSTAQSDSAILANTTAQGLRLGRKLPAGATVSFASDTYQTIPPYTQFSGAGQTWFNPEQIVLRPGVPITTVLYEGQVKRVAMQGLGTNLQAWVSPEGKFVVSDQHTQVALNGVNLYKTFEGLWNYPQTSGSGGQQLAFADRTLADGRLLVQFGSQGYGAVPAVNDQVLITYVVTQGDTLNSVITTGSSVTAIGYTAITAEFTSNPTGGAAQRNPVAYKNFGVGTFGTFSSGVTRQQYQSIVNSYPGVIDTVTQSQREINPSSLAWMNVIRVSALTTSPWTQPQIRDYLNYCQSQTMYSTYMMWQDPLAVDVDVDIGVYCFNSVPSLTAVKAKVTAAIQKLFAPRPGLLLTNFYESDLVETAKNAAPGQISYVVVRQPTTPMVVTSPPAPTAYFTIVPSGGTLAVGVYSYAISVNTPVPNVNFMGLFTAGPFTNYPNATAAGQYWIVNKAGNVRDPLSGALLPVAVGDQLLATAEGNLAANFSIVTNPSGVIDVGSPTNYVFPQVTVGSSQVSLDWSASTTHNAIQYFVWGRVGGSVGIIGTVSADTTSFIDDGSFTPVAVPTTSYSEAAVRYNRLNNLTVTAEFADRQTNATFPVRDTI